MAHVGGQHDWAETWQQCKSEEREERFAHQGTQREQDAREAGVAEALYHGGTDRHHEGGRDHAGDRRAPGEQGRCEREHERHATNHDSDGGRLSLLERAEDQ
jgi:hypothetical protein